MQAEAVKATRRRTVWNVLRRNLSLTAGCLILLCVVFTALFPGLIASQSPTDQNLTAMLAAPSAQHIWGTDELGRDIFARVIWGTRYDLVITRRPPASRSSLVRSSACSRPISAAF
ncbi:MAG: hypothetical protein ACLRZH_09330 [Ruthenibacterium lactatiformans]